MVIGPPSPRQPAPEPMGPWKPDQDPPPDPKPQK